MRKARSALQGLRVISKYFTTIVSFSYSCLYHGSQIWLVPSLKSILKTKLYSASGAALRLLNRDTSFKELPKKHNRAIPTLFQKYTTAISLYYTSWGTRHCLALSGSLSLCFSASLSLFLFLSLSLSFLVGWGLLLYRFIFIKCVVHLV